MMTGQIARVGRWAMMATMTACLAAGAARAQSGNAPIDSDLVKPGAVATPVPAPATAAPTAPAGQGASYAAAPAAAPATPAPAGTQQTYREDDLIGAAESVFGKGAKGVAQAIQSILKKQGEPNGYIKGREAGGAIAVGLRYGSGTLFHKVEGQRPVYWTGPSIGFDGGASAGNTFVLVYNLYNSDDLFKRFGAGEAQAYAVGGLNVSYLRRGDVVLIPVRAGVGLRLGINAGYMKFSKKQNWFPL
jgi:hypothetical protein